jgi:hypothetical protein
VRAVDSGGCPEQDRLAFDLIEVGDGLCRTETLEREVCFLQVASVCKGPVLERYPYNAPTVNLAVVLTARVEL